MSPVRVWAPAAGRVDLVLDGAEHAMAPEGESGWWAASVNPEHGGRYAFRLDGGQPLPDPRSRWQPDGVHAPSAVYDHSRFSWTDGRWSGRALSGAVVYELHVGTFTPEGTLDAAGERLDHLLGLGVTHVELLPVAAFDGPHGWGYDGVHLGAVHEPYGGPDALKRFVDRAHGAGLGVVLDVVYNHLGPSGNYLPAFGPYFIDSHTTPWGAAVNLDAPGSDEVRRWIIDNACSWLRDFRLDGLRLDAVQAFEDDRALHLLEDLSAEVDALAVAVNRPLFLVAESDQNDPRLVTPREAGGLGIHAQWSDDFHHALHTLLTGERQGYYADFGSLATLAHTLTHVFLHDGRWSSFRGRRHGRPIDVGRIPGWRFLGYLQDHDQVGNRACGDRISAGLSPGCLAIGAALVLTAPFTPMLFMGEEWAAGTPWSFFSSFPDPELARAVTAGRRHEFARHGWDAPEVPDPQDPATFASSKLDWSEPGREPHASTLAWYRRLIALRRERGELSDPRLDRVRCDADEQARTLVVHRGGLRVAANLAPEPRTIQLDRPGWALLAASHPQAALAGPELRLPAESAAIVELA